MFGQVVAVIGMASVLLVGCAQPVFFQGSQDKASLSADQVFERASPSVVVILVADKDGNLKGQGSGVVVTPRQVITNWHVINDSKNILVFYQGYFYPAQLNLADPMHDLCQLKVANLPAPPIAMRSSKNLRIGERAYTIGAPRLIQDIENVIESYQPYGKIDLSKAQLSISEGIISSLQPADGSSQVIKTSASFSQGSSGGGLFDQQGQLVGITTQYTIHSDSINLHEALKKNGNITMKQDTLHYFALPTDWIGELPFRSAVIAQTGQEDYVEWLQEAVSLTQNKNWPKLIEHCQTQISKKPTVLAPYLYLSYGLNESGQYQKAAAVAAKAITIDNISSTAWNNLGSAYSYLKQYDKAIEALEQAKQLDPNNASAWNNLGSTYNELKQYDKAIEALEQAKQLDPNNASAWNNLGFTYNSLNRYESAAKAFETAVNLSPDNANFLFGLGKSYYFLGRKKDVASVYQKLSTLDQKTAQDFSNQFMSADLSPTSLPLPLPLPDRNRFRF